MVDICNNDIVDWLKLNDIGVSFHAVIDVFPVSVTCLYVFCI